MDRLGIRNRLGKAGLRDVAETYREEVRQRIAKAQGGPKRNRDAVVDEAWAEMWEVFKPTLERWEKKQDNSATPLAGCADDPDLFLDPNYSETDPGIWIRDGLIWTAAEIRRVVIDSDDGTTVNLAKAKTPPPTAWAVFCLESFARKPPDKRAELIGRVLTFATRIVPTESQITEEHDDEGFLNDIS